MSRVIRILTSALLLGVGHEIILLNEIKPKSHGGGGRFSVSIPCGSGAAPIGST